MPYEVTKTIAGRPYRYRVDRVRDEATGRMRSRWTYLGRGDAADEIPAQPRRRSGVARERILDALERLLAERALGELTADLISREAGLAHGTFYRHFRDKGDALRGALARLRASRPPFLETLRDDVPDRAAARTALRGLAAGLLAFRAEHPALLRAWFELASRDPGVGEERRARIGAARARLAEHLRALAARGICTASDPTATASVIFTLLDSYERQRVVHDEPVDAATAGAILETIDRAAFGTDG